MDAKKIFEERLTDNPSLQKLMKKKNISYNEAFKLSGLTAKEFRRALIEAYPEGVPKELIARELLPMLNRYFMINKSAGEAAQAAVNSRMGIGLAVKSPTSKGAIREIITAAEAVAQEQVAEAVAGKVEAFGRTVVADCLKENAALHNNYGIKAYAIRHNPKLGLRGKHEACAYCDEWEGEWEYPFPDEIFGFHEGCKCWLEYYSKNGTLTTFTVEGRE